MRRTRGLEIGPHAGRLGAEDCTPEITKVKFHRNMPLKVLWTFPVTNPLDKCQSFGRYHWQVNVHFLWTIPLISEHFRWQSTGQYHCSALLRATAARYIRFRPHPPFVTLVFFQVSVRSPTDDPPGFWGSSVVRSEVHRLPASSSGLVCKAPMSSRCPFEQHFEARCLTAPFGPTNPPARLALERSSATGHSGERFWAAWNIYHICIYLSISLSLYIYIYIHVYICIYIYIHIYIYIYIIHYIV